MVIKESDIRMAINEVLDDFAMPTWMGDERNPKKPYTTKDQWNDEIDLFMIELQRGNFIEFGDRSIGVEWRAGGAKNDPRYIVFEFGDARLRDDHFFMQHSPRLSDDDLKTIRDVMVRMGMVTKEEFDMEYGLNMDNSYYESRIDRIVRDTINEAMYHKFPDNETMIKKLIGRKPKSLRARKAQVYKLCNDYYGLDKDTYNDNGWAAIGKYKSAIESLGCDVSVYPCARLDKPQWDIQSDGGYCDYDPNDHMPRSKQYKIEITYPDGMVIEGYIKCMAAGSMEDPFDRYDTCMALWNKPKRRYDESLIHRTVNESISRLLNEWERDEFPEDFADDAPSPNGEWEGIYDLTTDTVCTLYDAGKIEIATDEFGGIHEFVVFTATPNDYRVDDDPGDYYTPGYRSIEIYSYEITPDECAYTTVKYDDDGFAYYDDSDENAHPFEGFTPEQEKKITEYLNKNVSNEFWDFE